jgi:hypothetical protein
MRRSKKLAVAVSAMSIAAVGGGIGAAGAQAQNEVLPATTTTFSGGGSYCFNGSGYANFNAGGSATGGKDAAGNVLPAPYQGTFTAGTLTGATSPNVKVIVPLRTVTTLTLLIPFTITSGKTTITGTVTNPPPYSGGSLGCTGGLSAAWVSVAASGATYTATIQTKGQPDQNVTGTAQVSAVFAFRPRHVVLTPPTVTLLNFPTPT